MASVTVQITYLGTRSTETQTRKRLELIGNNPQATAQSVWDIEGSKAPDAHICVETDDQKILGVYRVENSVWRVDTDTF